MVFDMSRLAEESVKTFNEVNRAFLRLFDPAFYFQLSEDEITDSITAFMNGTAEIWELGLRGWMDFLKAVWKGDADEMIEAYLRYLSKLEDAVGRMMDNPLASAYLNKLNEGYLKSIQLIQSMNDYLFHTLGLATKKDIIALGEAYVDLKGDLKKEMKSLKEAETESLNELKGELVKLRKSLEKLKR